MNNFEHNEIIEIFSGEEKDYRDLMILYSPNKDGVHTLLEYRFYGDTWKTPIEKEHVWNFESILNMYEFVSHGIMEDIE